ncbi:hypothetical protein MKW94_010988 [Papaver nudicaule]|uniref:Uncharacterized protein n=1 Tax=Papaver nudicaule TaxID=74823 RepID=A0AA41VTU4_PAPNU|nr:hypothetical protein [Papaver nudicaule]
MEEQNKSPTLVRQEQKKPTLDQQEQKNPTTLEHQEQKNPTLDHQEQKIPSTLPVDDTFSFSSENESSQHQQDEQESDFEFGSLTPGSPTSDSSKNSPADLLFFNGQLLPHVFPGNHIDLAGAKSKPIVGANKNSTTTKKLARVQPYSSTMPKSKWQFIKPAPVLTSTTDTCRSNKIETVAVRQKPKMKKKIKTKKKRSRSVRSWIGWRIFRSIVWACRTCHSLDS